MLRCNRICLPGVHYWDYYLGAIYRSQGPSDQFDKSSSALQRLDYATRYPVIDPINGHQTTYRDYSDSANGKRRYNVMSSLIGWAHTQNNPWTWPSVATKFAMHMYPQLSPLQVVGVIVMKLMVVRMKVICKTFVGFPSRLLFLETLITALSGCIIQWGLWNVKWVRAAVNRFRSRLFN